MIFEDIFVKYGEVNRKNDAFLSLFSEEKIKQTSQKTGIFNRRVCAEKSNAISLAKSLIYDIDLKARIRSQKLIIVVSECVSQVIPPPSSLIFDSIDAFEGQVIDLNRGCSGFVEALMIVDAYFQADIINEALIVAADSYSKHFGLENKSVSMVFGDCASFSFVKKSGTNILFSDTMSKFVDNKHISLVGDELNMDGPAVLGFVRAHVLPQILKVLDYANRSEIKLTKALVHQGSKIVVDEIRKKNAWDEDFCPFFVGDCGNVNASTIPVGLKVILDDKGFIEGNFLLSGFGVGLSSSTILLPLSEI